MPLRLKVSALDLLRAPFFFDEAASGASVAGSVVNFEMDVPGNFSDWETLRKTKIFQELYRKVELSVAPGKERNCLSHHTTRSCRRDRAPIESLKDCGMEVAIPSPCGSGVHVHVHLPHTFYNDDSWGFHYYSPTCPNYGTAKKIACLEILTTLLSMQPKLVRLPSSCVADPSQLRDAGCNTHFQRVLFWLDPFGSVTRWEPLVTDESIHAVSGARQHYTPGTSDMEILSVMMSWAFKQPADSRRLPKHAWMYLRSVLPRGGMWDFFVRNNNAFNYWREGKSIRFQFRDEYLQSIGAASGAHAEAGMLMLMIVDGQIENNDGDEVEHLFATNVPASGGLEEEVNTLSNAKGDVVEDVPDSGGFGGGRRSSHPNASSSSYSRNSGAWRAWTSDGWTWNEWREWRSQW